jgi:UDP-glucose:glycoprotein glucosyltransferase
MDVPPSWLVSPRRSVHDLDNLRLDAISAFESVIDLTFELEQLVVEGHAREENGEPPRGLQLQLSSSKGEVLADTSVMANLGYFQFKANPGVLRFGIRSGPGTKIYSLDSVQNAATGAEVKPSDRLAVTSFQGLTILPIFKRRPGMEAADVLSLGAEETKPSLWNRIKSP